MLKLLMSIPIICSILFSTFDPYVEPLDREDRESIFEAFEQEDSNEESVSSTTKTSATTFIDVAESILFSLGMQIPDSSNTNEDDYKQAFKNWITSVDSVKGLRVVDFISSVTGSAVSGVVSSISIGRDLFDFINDSTKNGFNLSVSGSDTEQPADSKSSMIAYMNTFATVQQAIIDNIDYYWNQDSNFQCETFACYVINYNNITSLNVIPFGDDDYFIDNSNIIWIHIPSNISGYIPYYSTYPSGSWQSFQVNVTTVVDGKTYLRWQWCNSVSDITIYHINPYSQPNNSTIDYRNFNDTDQIRRDGKYGVIDRNSRQYDYLDPDAGSVTQPNGPLEIQVEKSHSLHSRTNHINNDEADLTQEMMEATGTAPINTDTNQGLNGLTIPDLSNLLSNIGMPESFDNVVNYAFSQIDNFVFERPSEQFINVALWLSTQMETIFFLTDFHQVFTMLCVLVVAGFLIGFARLWSGVSDPDVKKSNVSKGGSEPYSPISPYNQKGDDADRFIVK